MVKSPLPQPGSGQELEGEENLALRNGQRRGGVSQGQSHSRGFAVPRGVPMSSQLPKEEITLWMLLVFTLPAGLSSEQRAKTMGEREEMALQGPKAECAARRRLGRGRFLGAKQCTVRLKEDEWGLGASQMQKQ